MKTKYSRIQKYVGKPVKIAATVTFPSAILEFADSQPDGALAVNEKLKIPLPYRNLFPLCFR